MAPVQAQASKIVGLGAAPCSHFLADVAANPAMERDYFAWSQGFMSGVLMRVPPGLIRDSTCYRPISQC